MSCTKYSAYGSVTAKKIICPTYFRKHQFISCRKSDKFIWIFSLKPHYSKIINVLSTFSIAKIMTKILSIFNFKLIIRSYIDYHIQYKSGSRDLWTIYDSKYWSSSGLAMWFDHHVWQQIYENPQICPMSYTAYSGFVTCILLKFSCLVAIFCIFAL